MKMKKQQTYLLPEVLEILNNKYNIPLGYRGLYHHVTRGNLVQCGTIDYVGRKIPIYNRKSIRDFVKLHGTISRDTRQKKKEETLSISEIEERSRQAN